MSGTARAAEDLTDLADQLCCEYTGALPPAQVLALVLRADLMVSTESTLDTDARLTTVKTVVRRLLTERLAVIGRSHPGGCTTVHDLHFPDPTHVLPGRGGLLPLL